MKPWVLALNVGSSSVKFAVHDAIDGGREVRGGLSGLPGRATFSAHPGQAREIPCESLESAIGHVLDWALDRYGAEDLQAVGHRIVHGGRAFEGPTELTPEVKTELDGLARLAPLHQPFGLLAIEQVETRAPKTLQVGCFDTAFHSTLAEVERLFPLPRALAEKGVARYGFHGLSYEYVAGELVRRLGPAAGGRTIVAHLGSGASLCALQAGRSVATTMGMTPLGGVPMATRPGDLDPGVLLHLMEEGMGPAELRELLYRRSGLLGLSGESGDMRILLRSASAESQMAVELFVRRLAREIGSLTAALGGLDTLVFTGGIGENSPEIRARVCDACAWLGVRLDAKANDEGASELHETDSPVQALRIATDEEAVIAAQVLGRLKPECGSVVGV